MNLAENKAVVDLGFEGFQSQKSLVISRVSLAPAAQVHLEWITEPPPIIRGEESKLPIRLLRPGGTVDSRCAFHTGSPRDFTVRAHWTNPDGTEATAEFDLHAA
jgi:hypothetical protein